MARSFKHLTDTAWQLTLLALLGLPGVLFIPLLLRWVSVEAMADILVMQVYAYYLVLLAQYGFFVSGPAALAGASESAAHQLLDRSLRCKSLVLLGPVLAIFLGLLILRWQSGGWYLLGFVPLLVAYALNSNWFIQARGDFGSGVLFAALGVLVSCVLLMLVGIGASAWPTVLLGWLSVGVLVLPQSVLGVASAWRARMSSPGAGQNGEGKRLEIASDLRSNLSLVLAQFLALACTTLGTVVVGALADVETTAAYAATEKLFNLAATLLVGVYMALYPRLAAAHYNDPKSYWQLLWRLLLGFISFGVAVVCFLNFWGFKIFGLYLGESLASLVQPVWLPLGLWLGLCITQQMLSGYLVIVRRNQVSLGFNGLILLCTVLLGGLCAWINPIAWVWGMVGGQVLALLMLVWFYRRDMVLCAEGLVQVQESSQ